MKEKNQNCSHKLVFDDNFGFAELKKYPPQKNTWFSYPRNLFYFSCIHKLTLALPFHSLTGKAQCTLPITNHKTMENQSAHTEHEKP